jgi:hypothetical protein
MLSEINKYDNISIQTNSRHVFKINDLDIINYLKREMSELGLYKGNKLLKVKNFDIDHLNSINPTINIIHITNQQNYNIIKSINDIVNTDININDKFFYKIMWSNNNTYLIKHGKRNTWLIIIFLPNNNLHLNMNLNNSNNILIYEEENLFDLLNMHLTRDGKYLLFLDHFMIITNNQMIFPFHSKMYDS